MAIKGRSVLDIFQLKSIIGELSEREAKSLILQVMLRVDLLKETDYSDDEFIRDIKRIYEQLAKTKSGQPILREKHVQKTHIPFSDSVKDD